MADDFYGYDEDEAEPKGHDNLFLWTVFILLLIGAAAACWMGSFYIFGHPELPKSYAFLKKLHKIDPPLRFEETAAPPGEFLNPQKIFDRYSKFTRLELEDENGELIRNYIRNFRDTKKLVTYVTGHYVILDAYDLKPSDMFPSGMVALAQATDFSQVVIEHVYCTSPANVAAWRSRLQTGQPVKLERTKDLSALIHVEKTPDGHLQLTVVPLLYSRYEIAGQGSGTLILEPPPDLNMVPGLPVIKNQGFQEAEKKYASYRRDHPLPSGEPNAPEANATPKPELVRVETVGPSQPVPPTGALPPVAVATPVPIPGQPTPRIAAAATPALIARDTPPPLIARVTPRPAATPPMQTTMISRITPIPAAPPVSEVPAITPLPAGATPLPRTSPGGVPLQPFLQAQRDPTMTSNGESWRTFAPGQAPPARTITVNEIPALADRGDLGERVYLRGEFRVTASGTSRAVLRDATLSDDQSPRIVVEYPAGAIPPQEKERFVRDAARPYLVSAIRRGADGVVTIYVREIINQ